MNNIIKKAGIVGVACLMVLMLSSSPSMAWSWSISQPTRSYWTEYQQAADPSQYDAYHTIDVFNGHGLQIVSLIQTGGSTMYNPTEIHIGDHSGQYLIFHSKATFYMYWGSQDPQRPDGCVQLYGQASLELQEWNGEDFVPASSTEVHSSSLVVWSTPGTLLTYRYLHVWDDTLPLVNNDIYRLYIYSVGGWIDGQGVKHPDNSPATNYEFYKIKNP